LLVPLQVSAMSQPPATAARHTVPAGCTASAGQVVDVPVQVSAMSQPPATAARHIVPAFPAGCVQSRLVPSQTSRVHTLPSSGHAVPLALAGWVHAGAPTVPLQTSLVHT
ncbi:MAG: hypothetical protein DMD36_18770, partial [Gemmatimonadetes bacterium]